MAVKVIYAVMSANKEDLKGDLEGLEDQTQDAVFGEITEEGPNYRNVRTTKPPPERQSHAID